MSKSNNSSIPLTNDMIQMQTVSSTPKGLKAIGTKGRAMSKNTKPQALPSNTLVKSGVMVTDDEAKKLMIPVIHAVRPELNSGVQKQNHIHRVVCDYFIPTTTKKDGSKNGKIWVRFNERISEKNGRTYKTAVIKSYLPKEVLDNLVYKNDKDDKVHLVSFYQGQKVVRGEEQIEVFKKCASKNNTIEIFA